MTLNATGDVVNFTAGGFDTLFSFVESSPSANGTYGRFWRDSITTAGMYGRIDGEAESVKGPFAGIRISNALPILFKRQ